MSFLCLQLGRLDFRLAADPTRGLPDRTPPRPRPSDVVAPEVFYVGPGAVTGRVDGVELSARVAALR